MQKSVVWSLRWLTLAVALIAAPGYAQTGPGYAVISPPQPTASGNKVEVIEVFSYGCIHCAHFQPYVDAWLGKADKSAVQFSYLPATFNPTFKLLARAYYAAESMNVVAATHQRVFDAIFVQGRRVQTFDDIANLYASLGVDRAKFMGAASSFFVESQVRRADELMIGYGIDGTPSVIVAGKYRVSGDTAGGNDKVFAVVEQLIAKERQAMKATPVKK